MLFLRGMIPVSKLLWTHLAQPYHPKFALAAGNAMLHAADDMYLYPSTAVWQLS